LISFSCTALRRARSSSTYVYIRSVPHTLTLHKLSTELIFLYFLIFHNIQLTPQFFTCIPFSFHSFSAYRRGYCTAPQEARSGALRVPRLLNAFFAKGVTTPFLPGIRVPPRTDGAQTITYIYIYVYIYSTEMCVCSARHSLRRRSRFSVSARHTSTTTHRRCAERFICTHTYVYLTRIYMCVNSYSTLSSQKESLLRFCQACEYHHAQTVSKP